MQHTQARGLKVGVLAALAVGLVLGAITPATAAGQGGPKNAVVISGLDIFASAESGEPVVVRPGRWYSFEMGWTASDDMLADNLENLTMEVFVDGELVPTTSSKMVDKGEYCWTDTDCADADELLQYSLSRPLSAGTHEVTLKYTMVGAGTDGLGFSWGDEGFVFAPTGTIKVTRK